jgi:hypothetical protein
VEFVPQGKPKVTLGVEPMEEFPSAEMIAKAMLVC